MREEKPVLRRTGKSKEGANADGGGADLGSPDAVLPGSGRALGPLAVRLQGQQQLVGQQVLKVCHCQPRHVQP